MTVNDIREFFGNDNNLLDYFDPESKASSNEEAINEIYQKLMEHSKEKDCTFKRTDVGYIFYSDKLLISFCVKPECRNRKNLAEFGEFIKLELGSSFSCYLYNRNEKAIRFLEKLGLEKIDSNSLITLLHI